MHNHPVSLTFASRLGHFFNLLPDPAAFLLALSDLTPLP